jgi:hypothetical protein
VQVPVINWANKLFKIPLKYSISHEFSNHQEENVGIQTTENQEESDSDSDDETDEVNTQTEDQTKTEEPQNKSRVLDAEETESESDDEKIETLISSIKQRKSKILVDESLD